MVNFQIVLIVFMMHMMLIKQTLYTNINMDNFLNGLNILIMHMLKSKKWLILNQDNIDLK